MGTHRDPLVHDGDPVAFPDFVADGHQVPRQPPDLGAHVFPEPFEVVPRAVEKADSQRHGPNVQVFVPEHLKCGDHFTISYHASAIPVPLCLNPVEPITQRPNQSPAVRTRQPNVRTRLPTVESSTQRPKQAPTVESSTQRPEAGTCRHSGEGRNPGFHAVSPNPGPRRGDVGSTTFPSCLYPVYRLENVPVLDAHVQAQLLRPAVQFAPESLLVYGKRYVHFVNHHVVFRLLRAPGRRP